MVKELRKKVNAKRNNYGIQNERQNFEWDSNKDW